MSPLSRKPAPKKEERKKKEGFQKEEFQREVKSVRTNIFDTVQRVYLPNLPNKS